jgi:hypothetical protein
MYLQLDCLYCISFIFPKSFKSIPNACFLVLVASKRIRHNQIKTDKVGVLKNHAPIVGCKEQQFE